jgi:hypothetical protein
MEISPLNGKSIGVLELNNYIRVRTSKNITPKNIKIQLNKILKGIDLKHSIYTLDISTEDNKHEFNILIQSNELNFSDKIYKNISGKGDIRKEKTKILVVKSITNFVKGKKEVKKESEFKIVNTENIFGKSIEIRIEPILDSASTLYYLNRYIKPNFITGLILPSTIKNLNQVLTKRI